MATKTASTGLALLIALVVGSGAVRANGRESAIVEKAIEVLDTSTKIPENCIPNALLSKAQGVLIMPNVVKAGLLVGGRHGRGVLLVRTRDGGWSNPVFVGLTGGSFGWQGGIQSADLVLVFKTYPGVERILQGKGKLTLGGDISIAAGPVGRQSSAATDVLLKAEIFSYSRSRGLFLGLSLEGDGLYVDWRGNDSYYGRIVTPADIVGGELATRESALRLRTLLTTLSGPKGPPPPVVVPGPIVPGPVVPAPIQPVPQVQPLPPTSVTPMKPLTSEPPLATPLPPR
jgi:lipid-binding SYLF domain-containing protein